MPTILQMGQAMLRQTVKMEKHQLQVLTVQMMETMMAQLQIVMQNEIIQKKMPYLKMFLTVKDKMI